MMEMKLKRKKTTAKKAIGNDDSSEGDVEQSRGEAVGGHTGTSQLFTAQAGPIPFVALPHATTAPSSSSFGSATSATFACLHTHLRRMAERTASRSQDGSNSQKAVVYDKTVQHHNKYACVALPYILCRRLCWPDCCSPTGCATSSIDERKSGSGVNGSRVCLVVSHHSRLSSQLKLELNDKQHTIVT